MSDTKVGAMKNQYGENWLAFDEIMAATKRTGSDKPTDYRIVQLATSWEGPVVSAGEIAALAKEIMEHRGIGPQGWFDGYGSFYPDSKVEVGMWVQDLTEEFPVALRVVDIIGSDAVCTPDPPEEKNSLLTSYRNLKNLLEIKKGPWPIRETAP
jgi:hypothetical protein